MIIAVKRNKTVKGEKTGLEMLDKMIYESAKAITEGDKARAIFFWMIARQCCKYLGWSEKKTNDFCESMPVEQTCIPKECKKTVGG